MRDRRDSNPRPPPCMKSNTFVMAWTISSPFLKGLGASVSSLYGAPPNSGGSHGVHISFDLVFTVIPKLFILKFPLEAARLQGGALTN